MTKPLILVDGSSYLFRAYHALPPLTNSTGMPTGAIYGVINMLRRLIKDYDPEYIAVIFDTKGDTFRNELYPEYKANRDEMPEELAIQIQPLHDTIRAMGLPLIAVGGVEADDVIGTLTTIATHQKMDVVVSTGDKDMAQLVNQHVSLVNTMSNKKYNADGVKEKFGVTPEQIVDYLTLMGDTADNIPGVPKVGPKTAAKWLNEYNSLDNIVDNADAIKGKVGGYFREFIPKIPLTRQLVTIKCDVPLEQQPKDLTPSDPDHAALVELFKTLEFKTWLKEELAKAGDAPKTTEPTEKKSGKQAILTEDAFNALLTTLEKADLFAFDTETTSLDYMQAEVVGMSFATNEKDAVYLPVAHHYEGAPTQLNRETVFEKLKPILESDSHKKVGQNLKYDKEVLANHNIELKGIAFDTMLESYVFNSTASRHDMNSLALKYLGHSCISFEEVAGKGAKQVTFDQVALDVATDYAAEDADITLRLHQHLWPLVQKDKKLQKIFTDLEMPLLSVLAHMEREGILLDVALLEKQSQELAKKIEALQTQAFDIAGREFNMSSPKQLQEILFGELKLPVLKKTPKGQASTSEEVLRDLSLDYPLPKVILEYRSLTKLKSTYTDRLPEQVDTNTKRVHTSFHQAVTSTGRLSSSNPNLQNIPIRTEEGRRIRQAFIAPKDHTIVAADYSQIELRIMAHLSNDKSLITAFDNNEDIHSSTAAQVFGVPLESVNKEQRRKAKAINFGLIYGMSAFGLAKQISVDRHTAQAYIDEYFRQYPGVKQYMEETRRVAHEKGYVETVIGRRLYLNEINASNIMRQKAAERMAINAPMQGTAADIIKKAMIDIHHWLGKSTLDAKMILQVHDELIFEVANADVASLKENIRELMESAVKLAVPLIVDIGEGQNWDEAH